MKGRRWGPAALIAVGAITAAYFASAQSLAVRTLSIDPARATAIAPWDGMIAGRYARAVLEEATQGALTGIGPQGLTKAATVARSAILREGMSLDAVLTLGIVQLSHGDGVRARGYLNYARMLSKRDLQVQLWAVEDAVSRNDIAQVLREYDIAMRTSQNGRDVMFPVLAQAISTEPVVRQGAIELLSQRPFWAPAFLFFLAREGPDPRATADVFRGLYQRRFPVAEGASAILVDKLIGIGALDQAWNFYGFTHGKLRRDTSRDPHFTDQRSARSSLDWQLFGDNGNLATIETGDSGNVLNISIPAGDGGLLARQTQLLSPGRYILRGHGSVPGQPEQTRPYWELRCADGRDLGRVALPATEGSSDFVQSFVVPAGCPLQQLSLIGHPHDQSQPIEGTIDAIEIQPLS